MFQQHDFTVGETKVRRLGILERYSVKGSGRSPSLSAAITKELKMEICGTASMVQRWTVRKQMSDLGEMLLLVMQSIGCKNVGDQNVGDHRVVSLPLLGKRLLLTLCGKV